jgi:hypothetical protein
MKKDKRLSLMKQEIKNNVEDDGSNRNSELVYYKKAGESWNNHSKE